MGLVTFIISIATTEPLDPLAVYLRYVKPAHCVEHFTGRR
jgi:hypothetical protein